MGGFSGGRWVGRGGEAAAHWLPRWGVVALASRLVVRASAAAPYCASLSAGPAAQGAMGARHKPLLCVPPPLLPALAQEAARAARKRRAGALIEGGFLEEGEGAEGGEGEGEGAAGEGGEPGDELAAAERRYAAELAKELKVGAWRGKVCCGGLYLCWAMLCLCWVAGRQAGRLAGAPRVGRHCTVVRAERQRWSRASLRPIQPPPVSPPALQAAQQSAAAEGESESEGEEEEGGSEDEEEAAAAGQKRGRGGAKAAVAVGGEGEDAGALADVMMTRKNRKLYQSLQRSHAAKRARVESLEAKAAALKKKGGQA